MVVLALAALANHAVEQSGQRLGRLAGQCGAIVRLTFAGLCSDLQNVVVR